MIGAELPTQGLPPDSIVALYIPPALLTLSILLNTIQLAKSSSHSYDVSNLVQWRCPMEAYCMKCRVKREIQNPTQVTLKNGRPATQGTCPTCGAKVFRIGKG